MSVETSTTATSSAPSKKSNNQNLLNNFNTGKNFNGEINNSSLKQHMLKSPSSNEKQNHSKEKKLVSITANLSLDFKPVSYSLN